MRRPVLRLILDVVGTVLLALGWLTGLNLLFGGGWLEGARVLVNFMDVGLGIWLVLLIVVLLRSRTVSAGWTYLLLLIGTVVNLIVVAVVGFIQGGWAPLLVMFAIEAGVASLVAAAIIVPLVHRGLR